jgi:hypothetical protein
MKNGDKEPAKKMANCNEVFYGAQYHQVMVYNITNFLYG